MIPAATIYTLLANIPVAKKIASFGVYSINLEQAHFSRPLISLLSFVLFDYGEWHKNGSLTNGRELAAYWQAPPNILFVIAFLPVSQRAPLFPRRYSIRPWHVDTDVGR